MADELSQTSLEEKRVRKPKQIFSPAPLKADRTSLSQLADASQEVEVPKGNGPSTGDDPSSLKDEHLYCFCRQPYDGCSTMIDCERCKEFFHTSCIHLDVEITMDDDLSAFQYYCTKCVDELDDKVQDLSDKLEELQYSVEKKTSLIDQYDKDP